MPAQRLRVFHLAILLLFLNLNLVDQNKGPHSLHHGVACFYKRFLQYDYFLLIVILSGADHTLCSLV